MSPRQAQQESRIEMATLPVAIQGYEGSFHQVAARQFFGKQVQVVPCDTFRQVVTAASDNRNTQAGVMAIENSIAGSILANYNLLHKSDLLVVGEVYLHIRQHLLVNPGVKLEDIREVHSHTMALQQCYDFLDTHKWKLVETDDTALSARHIQQRQSKHIAAIASKLAAELYGLEILAPNIHTLKKNYTRFLILAKGNGGTEIAQADKASVYFHTDNSRGSLVAVLSSIADRGINLSKLQSCPIPGTDFKYGFHVDMEFDQRSDFEAVLKDISSKVEELKVYGIYKRGGRPDS
ncbi:MAG: prephenate dehydratase [Chitinophagaceae bacterium]